MLKALKPIFYPLWWLYLQFDQCDYCRAWRLANDMQEYYSTLLCKHCYKTQKEQAERQREINALSAERGGHR